MRCKSADVGIELIIAQGIDINSPYGRLLLADYIDMVRLQGYQSANKNFAEYLNLDKPYFSLRTSYDRFAVVYKVHALLIEKGMYEQAKDFLELCFGAERPMLMDEIALLCQHFVSIGYLLDK